MLSRLTEWRFLWPGMVHVVATLIALVLRHVVLRFLDRWFGREGPSLLVAAVRLPSIVWCIVLGFYIAIEVAYGLPRRVIDQLNLVLLAAIVVSVTITLANLLSSVIIRASQRRALHIQVSGLAQATAKTAVLVIGFMVLLGVLGVEITPLLTALGVGGLAVALALQDTLSNLFAGIHLLADKPIRVGDYVKVADGGVEGFVTDVGWRSTRVRTLLSNVIVVPNQTVAKSTITNYHLPDERVGVPMTLRVDLRVDPERVRALLFEEARKAIGMVPGLVADPPPAVWLMPGFGDWALEFTVIVWVATFVDQYEVQTQMRTRILGRLEREGIAMAVPIQTVRFEPGDGRAGVGAAQPTLGDRPDAPAPEGRPPGVGAATSLPAGAPP
jgi:small-conductance mechanosensitive channel